MQIYSDFLPYIWSKSCFFILTPYVYILEYVRYVLMMLDALYVVILWCVCMCSMLVCFTNYDKSLHLILVQPIPISPGWLKESLVPSFHQKNFCNKIGCTFLIQGVPEKSGLFYLNSSLLLLSRQMFRKSKLNEYLYDRTRKLKSLSFC